MRNSLHALIVVSADDKFDLSVTFNTTERLARYFKRSLCNSSSAFSTSSVTEASLIINSATLFEEWCKRNSQICRDFCISLLEALIEVKNPLVQAQEKEIRDKINKKYPSIADNQLLL